ncbi:hypothetical protein DPMN_086384 [Dreissena polymorpha]|uniref:Uncharacterized protein n=1 Tax=Dreissena polymorpha TaxID=45954 RepID=A0A9D4KQS4_DREPO|nr:hypothetical protein DPMN_086384 [Dreissena polymorpha]
MLEPPLVRLKEKAFNGVPVDQATEWIDRICKTIGGIIGTTRQDQARNRFGLTWSETILKADRQLMQRLFNADNSGRAVETASVLEHELSDNIADFAEFLSNQLLKHSENLPAGSTIVVGVLLPHDVSAIDLTKDACLNAHLKRIAVLTLDNYCKR